MVVVVEVNYIQWKCWSLLAVLAVEQEIVVMELVAEEPEVTEVQLNVLKQEKLIP
jgi:hypothetical protein